MIEISPPDRRVLAGWFPTHLPGPATIGEHVLATGVGRWWADRPVQPRVVAVSCAGHVVLRGSAEDLTPDVLAPLTGNRVEAPARFLPALDAAYDRLTPWERMIWTLQTMPQPATVPHAVTVRRLEPADADAVRALGPDASWLSAGWGGPHGLAASGHAWAALGRTGRVQAVAYTYFRGTGYEDVAVYTVPDRRRHHLALACVTALCADITRRGHTPGWNCSLHNRPSRLLAWHAASAWSASTSTTPSAARREALVSAPDGRRLPHTAQSPPAQAKASDLDVRPALAPPVLTQA
ncbi:GNAT family N-acetyltransferase [Streptomyces sp. NPDC050743]|uniref:GNAT family N-acetyltransferase n=1 Tax=Streptomyces sp. NPDC050743 TaxID=3365634 RepID=UPI0037960E8D